MKRTTLNLILDLAAALLLLAMVATGYILRFPLPPGTNKALSLWGLTRHQWGNVHSWISLALLAVVIVHVFLHWEWIVCMVRRRFGLSTKGGAGVRPAGIATLLVVSAGLIVFGWATYANVADVTEQQSGVCSPDEHSAGKRTTKIGAQTAHQPTDQTLSFQIHIYPIFERSCLHCHGPQKQAGGFRVDRPEIMFGNQGGAVWIVPGKSANSPLLDVVKGLRNDIPLQDRHRLSSEEVLLLKHWIDQGAQWSSDEDKKN